MKKAFTLIELLIVVAIIAILAAIAVPNFLEAQVRAKVSRSRADMRTVTVALESYAVDHNKYPYAQGTDALRVSGTQQLDGYGNGRTFGFGTLPPNITTPISYISSVPVDVFKVGKTADRHPAPTSLDKPYQTGNPFDMTFVYHPIRNWNSINDAFWTAEDIQDYGDWRMFSLGPDALYNQLGTADTTMGWIYDSSNGTISSGMILRTQKDPEGENFSRATP